MSVFSEMTAVETNTAGLLAATFRFLNCGIGKAFDPRAFWKNRAWAFSSARISEKFRAFQFGYRLGRLAPLVWFVPAARANAGAASPAKASAGAARAAAPVRNERRVPSAPSGPSVCR